MWRFHVEVHRAVRLSGRDVHAAAILLAMYGSTGAKYDGVYRMTDQQERDRKEYNAAVANGLILKARQIDRRMKSRRAQ
jgi:hypothetical protein